MWPASHRSVFTKLHAEDRPRSRMIPTTTQPKTPKGKMKNTPAAVPTAPQNRLRQRAWMSSTSTSPPSVSRSSRDVERPLRASSTPVTCEDTDTLSDLLDGHAGEPA